MKPTEPNLWGIHAGKTGDADTLFLKKHCNAIGWTRMGDASTIKPERKSFKAKVNALIQADHQSSRPINIVKRPDAFIFQNPGRLRIPREQLYQGGITDPRNPNLQKMFQMLGLGEKAGSGFQKILRAWREQHWLIPVVAENAALEMTRVWLPVTSMIPDDVERELRALVGDAYAGLDELERVILMLAHRFGEVGNADIQPYRSEHPRDIGNKLKLLVERGWLGKHGHGRGTRYRWPQLGAPDLFGGTLEMELSEHVLDDSPPKALNSQHKDPSFQHKDANSPDYEALRALAAPIRERLRAKPVDVRTTILGLCSGAYLSLRELAELLGRQPASVQNHYLTPMLKEGVLVQRYPGNPNHPN